MGTRYPSNLARPTRPMHPESTHIGIGNRQLYIQFVPRRPIILLINPRQHYRHYATQPQMCRLMGKEAIISPLSLVTVAALTPDTYDVRIVDEQLGPIPDGLQPVLVGITALTNTSARCYEIADHYRSQGVPVVLGGPHATFMLEEASAHADSVVVGEAEGAWQACLHDFETGNLQPTYRAEGVTAFATSPRPRWDLIDTRAVLSIPVQTSRGCPYNCEFCIVTKLFGRKIRHRDIDDVIDEIAAAPLKNILLVDDNLTKDRRYALRLMKKLQPLGVSWSCQASIDLAEDTELLERMSAAGCQHVIIGFESLNPDSLVDARKYHNRVSGYREAVERIHSAGIMVFASLLVGFDHDTLAELDRIRHFVLDMHLPYVILCPLAAPPGTDLSSKMIQEQRWYGWHISPESGVFPAMRYASFTHTALFDKMQDTLEQLYSFGDIRTRVRGLLASGHFAGRRRGGEFPLTFKLWMFVKICALYLLSRDRDKRRLFTEVMCLVRAKRTSIDVAVGILVAMEGFHRHMRLHRELRPVFRREFEYIDRCPVTADRYATIGTPNHAHSSAA